MHNQHLRRLDSSFRRSLRHVAPRTPRQLHRWLQVMLGLRLPCRALVAGHSSAFEYLCHAFFEDDRLERNAIVWAARGTGKTLAGAVATLLDMLFKPGIEICILGGSFAQSSRMHAHLRAMLSDEALVDLVEGDITLTHVQLRNGSRVEVLSQSQTAVRGRRVHRLRCDEVELFEPEVWEAAQMITRSGRCGGTLVRAGVEALSTLHKPYGLMNELVRNAPQNNARVFRWSAIDVLEWCPDGRVCDECPLFDEIEGGCHGRAKLRAVAARGTGYRQIPCNADGATNSGDDHQRPDCETPPRRMPAVAPRAVGGFFSIDDAIDQKARISPAAWRSEMLCRQPDVSDCVYPEFSEAVHLFDDADAPKDDDSIVWLGGIDFGYRAPTALLLAMLDGANRLHVVDEIVERGCATPRMIELARQQCLTRGINRAAGDALAHSTDSSGLNPPSRLRWIGADPAGLQRSDQSGVSTIALWRRAGFVMRTRATTIEAGIEAVRARIGYCGDRGHGAWAATISVGLRVHRRCVQLTRALREYHYPPKRCDEAPPVKDGPDHLADALRYMIVNLDSASWKAKPGVY